ncbi:MAG: hypothetical protein AAGL69_10915 [Pseudomonadota bacterium]
MANDLARQILRFAWHWTSALWILVGAYLVLAAQDLPQHALLVRVIGLVHLAAGLLDGYFTRGRHIGWPPITLIGVFALIGSFYGA